MRKISKEDWESSKQRNEELIVQNLMQIEMAKKVIELCDKKISEFPKEKEKKIPSGVN